MRVALYLRVSTDRQTAENQRDALEQMARARGWEPVTYEETASGAAKVRPVLERVLADAHRGKVGAVLVVALDRLGRSMAGVIETVRKLDACGCTVVSQREPWLDMGGPARELLLAVFGWVAQQERRMLVERTHAGLERARRQGKRLGRPPTALDPLQVAWVHRNNGERVASTARLLKVSRATVRRLLAAAERKRAELHGERGQKGGDGMPPAGDGKSGT